MRRLALGLISVVISGCFNPDDLFPVHGRVVLDVLTVMRREHKLSSYSLNSVAEHFLGEKKDDVPHSQISALHAGSAQDRAVLAKYCLKVQDCPRDPCLRPSCVSLPLPRTRTRCCRNFSFRSSASSST